MHLQDGPQRDLSVQVARTVKDKTRPWKSLIAFVLAIAAASVSEWARQYFPHFFDTNQPQTIPSQLISAGCALAFAAFGGMATYGLSGQARQALEKSHSSTSHAAMVRYALLLIGALTTLVITLGLFGIPIGQLVLGGALTSVVFGLAAQQSLGNVFAGLVLLIARPFHVGDSVRLRAGALGATGMIDGTVTDIGITYVRLDTGESVMAVPNSMALSTVVGPIPPPEGG
ncbi:MAG: mechanosensitive ion channel [Nocardiopsaceae bacterium]|nr:mechanosensitive ion channel [Nocardiopsaceae bacterium]